MNWNKDAHETDILLNRSLYDNPNSEADGIDLREEMNIILYGSPYKKPLGHWVVLRHFDRSSTSKYFNDISKEGIGGPAHKFTDTLLKTRRVGASTRSNTESVTKAGDIFSDKLVYYFEYDVVINNGDQIYELDVTDHSTKPTTYNFVEKYDVKRLHPYSHVGSSKIFSMTRRNYNNIFIISIFNGFITVSCRLS